MFKITMTIEADSYDARDRVLEHWTHIVTDVGTCNESLAVMQFKSLYGSKSISSIRSSVLSADAPDPMTAFELSAGQYTVHKFNSATMQYEGEGFATVESDRKYLYDIHTFRYSNLNGEPVELPIEIASYQEGSVELTSDSEQYKIILSR